MSRRASNAIRQLLAASFGDMTNNATRAMRNADALHRFRVSLRRSRILLHTFRKRIASTSADQLRRRLTDLGHALGPLRDEDVLLALLQRSDVLGRVGDHPRWSEFFEAQCARRNRLRERARRHLEGRTWTRSCALMEHLVKTEWPSVVRSWGAIPFETVAAQRLHKAFHSVATHRKLAHSTKPDKLHRLRIILRTARYLGECFSPALDREIRQMTDIIRECERQLGRIHDLNLALSYIKICRPAPPPELADVLQRRRKKLLRKFRTAWTDFERPSFQQRVTRRLKHLSRRQSLSAGPGA